MNEFDYGNLTMETKGVIVNYMNHSLSAINNWIFSFKSWTIY